MNGEHFSHHCFDKGKANGKLDDAVLVFRNDVGVIDICTAFPDGADYVWDSKVNTEQNPIRLIPLRNITNVIGKEIEW